MIASRIKSKHHQKKEIMPKVDDKTISLIAASMTMVIISGNIDLSVGSVLAFSLCFGAIAFQATYQLALGIFASLASSVAFGLFNGIITTQGKIPAFLVTLGTMGIARGLAMIMTKPRPIVITNPWYWKAFGDEIIGFLPASILWTAMVS